MKKTILFEGFYDTDSGYEFDMPMFLVQPVIRMFEAGNSGEVERIIEDYFIDWDIDGKPWKDENGLSKAAVRKDFESSKLKNKRFKYWSAMVEYESEDLFSYEIHEKTGF